MRRPKPESHEPDRCPGGFPGDAACTAADRAVINKVIVLFSENYF
jgi:hypothetical protein